MQRLLFDQAVRVTFFLSLCGVLGLMAAGRQIESALPVHAMQAIASITPNPAITSGPVGPLGPLGPVGPLAVPNTSRHASGTAFCIDASGVFATNRALAGAEQSTVKLVVAPSGPQTGEVEAKVIRRDVVLSLPAFDLALLKSPSPCVPLKIGSDDQLVETMELTALGLPARTLKPTRVRITSLLKLKGRLTLIFFTPNLDGGYVGGPLLDQNGNVVGILQDLPERSTVVNSATPANGLRTNLLVPDVTFTDGISVPYAERHVSRKMTAEVLGLLSATPYTVELTLPGKARPRVIPFSGNGSGEFSATAPLLEPEDELAVELTLPAGTQKARIPNRPLVAAGRPVYPLDVLKIERRDGNMVTTLLNGAAIAGPLAPVQARLEPEGTLIDLAAASLVQFFPILPTDIAAPYTLAVKTNGETVYTATGTTAIQGALWFPSPPASLPVISPTVFSGDRKAIALPAPLKGITPAAGGRYLLLEFPSLGQLGVFDVVSGAITRYLPLPSGAVLAAGGDRLFIFDRAARALQRWNLLTLEKELTATLREGDTIDALAMGFSASGPLLKLNAQQLTLYDPLTLVPIEAAGLDRLVGSSVPSPTFRSRRVSASSDGTTFVLASTNNNNGFRILSIEAGSAVIKKVSSGRGNRISLSADGQIVFADDRLWIPNGNPGTPGRPPASLDDFKIFDTSPVTASTVVVSTDPGYFARVDQTALYVYAASGRLRLFTLPVPAELIAARKLGSSPETLADVRLSLFLIPQADLLVTVSENLDGLILRRLNLLEELQKTGAEYLFVASVPLRQAMKGTPYRYTLDVKSRAGGITYSMQTGPPGMRIDARGVLEWDVPNTAAPEIPVVVSIRNASGQELLNTFTIRVAEPAGIGQ